MKNNIDSSLVLNRKIIIELQFIAAPKFIYSKGIILNKIDALNIIKGADWCIGDTLLKISDNKNEELIRNTVEVDINRISLISSKVNSIEKLESDFLKLYNTISVVLGDIKVTKIGCRILGTYKTKSTEYD